MEELDRFGNTGFDAPAAGIGTDDEGHGEVEVIGNQERRLFMAVALDYDLPQFSFVTAERDPRFVDQGVGILAFVMGNGDPLPRSKVVQELVTAAP